MPATGCARCVPTSCGRASSTAPPSADPGGALDDRTRRRAPARRAVRPHPRPDACRRCAAGDRGRARGGSERHRRGHGRGPPLRDRAGTPSRAPRRPDDRDACSRHHGGGARGVRSGAAIGVRHGRRAVTPAADREARPRRAPARPARAGQRGDRGAGRDGAGPDGGSRGSGGSDDRAVTQPPEADGGAVLWLTTQSLLFGAMAALLGVVANAMFLEAYGSGWLPATYILIGVAGVVISGAIARGAQRFDLLRIAVVVLGGAAVLFAVSWVIAVGFDGAWVSAPLLVLFPVLLQLGFVFIGGQAGRILDIAGIKASFPRIMAGFPVGAVIGGVLAVPLVGLTGRTEDLLLATAAAEAGFAAVVWATGRRYASQLVLAPSRSSGGPEGETDPADEISLRRLFARPFVALILAYQLLSALGSQVSDFLVFDRASAAFPNGEDLARFVGGYTAVMNAVSIGFLFLLAGPLLRRYGLRLGIAANPFVVTVLAAVMVVAFAAAGAASALLLAVVAAARIADIALTDGTTRTSINAMYQVLPPRGRIGIQTAVEGIGVPLAIGASGVLLIGLDALPAEASLPATIAALVVVCAAWTWIALRLYGAYGPALVDALRRRRLLDPDVAFEGSIEDAAVARRLLVSGDARSSRLGLELASTLAAPTLAPELLALVDDPDPEVRLPALAGLSAVGDQTARAKLTTEVRGAAASDDDRARLLAARLAGALGAGDRAAIAGLLSDDVVEVRIAALDAVQPGDTAAVEPSTAALRDPRSATAAMGAVGRLGDAMVPLLASVLADRDPATVPMAMRVVRAFGTATIARDEVLRRYVRHRDRALGLVVIDRLGGSGPAADDVAAELRASMSEDVEHGERILTALVAFEGFDRDEGDGPVFGALGDELDLDRARLAASLVTLYGRDRLGPAIGRLETGGEGVALATEALEVLIGQAESHRVLGLLTPSLSASGRLERLAPATGAVDDRRAEPDWLRSMARDAGDRWRSPWLRACAIRALRIRGLQAEVDVAAARGTRDPVVLEELQLLPV